jgi:hypothetical protein
MYPEDRVLVGVMPDPRDLDIARDRHWYRVPVKHAPTGIHAEYVAFYFTGKFDEELRWAIHYYARRTGHELVRRVDLFPDQPDHPRAHEQYYKLQLATLREKYPPIISRRWRRISFIQTTWDRFVGAKEVNDLFRSDDIFVDRIYHALRREGIHVERAVEVKDRKRNYKIDLLIPCKDGAVMVAGGADGPPAAIRLVQDEQHDLTAVTSAIEQRGGPLMSDLPL